MPKSYTPDVPYYEHNPSLPIRDVRKGDVISYRLVMQDGNTEFFGIVTKVEHDNNQGLVNFQFDAHSREYSLANLCTVELHGYVSEQALTRLFQS